jgi:hypothetical protein
LHAGLLAAPRGAVDVVAGKDHVSGQSFGGSVLPGGRSRWPFAPVQRCGRYVPVVTLHGVRKMVRHSPSSGAHVGVRCTNSRHRSGPSFADSLRCTVSDGVIRWTEMP